MIFKEPYVSHNAPVTSGTFVSTLVRRAEDYSDGRLEAVEHRLERLTEIVERMFAHLSDTQQKDIAESFGWTAWREK